MPADRPPDRENLTPLEQASLSLEPPYRAPAETPVQEALRIWAEALAAREAAADRHAARGDWPEAVAEYEAALRAAGESLPDARAVPLYLKVARAYEAVGRPDLAARACRAALARDPRNVHARERLREQLRASGEWRELAELLRDMVESGAGSAAETARVCLEAAALHDEELGDEEGALRYLRHAIRLGDPTGEATPRAAALLVRRGGDLRRLAEMLADAAQKGEGDADARCRAALALRASEILARDLDDEETAKDTLFAVAERLLATADGEEPAFELLHRIFELDPAYPPMLRAVADYHRADGEPGEARRFYARYLDVAPGALDASVVALRLSQIALGYEEEEEALGYLNLAARGALPDEEIATAKIVAQRLCERRPRDPEAAEVAAIVEDLAHDPRRLERELHRAANRADSPDRVGAARVLGRLREIRLGDREGAAVAYRLALRFAPADLVALGGVERVFEKEPSTVLALTREALEAVTDSKVERQLHAMAARAAARAGDWAAEALHHFLAFRLAPEDPAQRRRAMGRLRRTQRWADLVEVLRAEATWGNRVEAAIEAAEIIAGPLARPDAAVPWAEEALRAAREANREPEAARARRLLTDLYRRLAPAVVGPPPVAVPPPLAASEATPAWEPEIDLGWAEGDPGRPLPGHPPDEEQDQRAARAAVAKGLVLEAQGRFDEAAAAYEQALESMPRLREPLERLAQLHEQAGRREQARSCLERLFYVIETPRERALLRARHAALSGDPEGAAEDLRQALALGGEDVHVLDLCISVAADLGMHGLAAIARERRRRLGHPDPV
jgi:tetratricopeptide (TPR) repeat protein